MRNPYLADWIALALVALIIVVAFAVAVAVVASLVYALEWLWRRLRR